MMIDNDTFAIEWEIPANVPLESLRLVVHCAEPVMFLPPTEEEQLDALIDRALGKVGLVKVTSGGMVKANCEYLIPPSVKID